ncbi:MAG TPA: hypothetical protein VGG39_01860 [Polyangiaceae bacterium]
MTPGPLHLELRMGAIASHIVQRLADAAIDDMRARYDFGRILHELRSERRGAGQTGAVRILAERLGVDASALRRYAQVSAVIPEREFDWMMRLGNERGEPLTWSHIELLARVLDVEKRRQLASAVAREGLSVRALLGRLRAAPR